MLVRVFAILAILTFATSIPASAQPLDKVERICAASKLKATAKKASFKLKCEAKAILKEMESADPDCLAKAEGKFLTSFGKAELKGGCVSDGDAVAVEASVDRFVDGEVQRQKSGQGGLPPCPTPGAACGSCGTGMCVPYGTGQVCISTAGATSGCTSSDQCLPGQTCINLGSMLCVYPCL